MKACVDKTNLPKEVLRKTLHQYELLEYGSNKGEYTQKLWTLYVQHLKIKSPIQKL